MIKLAYTCIHQYDSHRQSKQLIVTKNDIIWNCKLQNWCGIVIYMWLKMTSMNFIDLHRLLMVSFVVVYLAPYDLMMWFSTFIVLICLKKCNSPWFWWRTGKSFTNPERNSRFLSRIRDSLLTQKYQNSRIPEGFPFRDFPNHLLQT